MSMNISQHNLAEHFVVMTPAMDAVPERNRPSLYADLDSRYQHFAGHVLISQHHFTESWPSWEVHPRGDEVVTLLAGRATMVLETAGGEQAVALDTPGDYVVVPRNTWHTARVDEPCTLMFFTPGEGTDHREA